MKPRYWRSNTVEILRNRLGRATADRLMSDAAMFGAPHRRALERRVEADIEETASEKEGIVLITMAMRGGPPAWRDDILVVDKEIPETIIDLLPGRRLGDVVSGSGADDHIIGETWNRDGGTRIRVVTDFVRARDIPISAMARITQPLRWQNNMRFHMVEDTATWPTKWRMAFQIIIATIWIAWSILLVTLPEPWEKLRGDWLFWVGITCAVVMSVNAVQAALMMRKALRNPPVE